MEKAEIFGDKASFAVVCALEHIPTDKWMDGVFYYYLMGKKIGDDFMMTNQMDTMFMLEEIVINHGKRINKALYEMDDKEAFDIIDKSLYGEEEDERIYSYIGDEGNPSIFEIQARVATMRGAAMYLVSNGIKDKVFFQEHITDEIFVYYFEHGFVEGVLTDCCRYLQRMYKTVMPDYDPPV